MGISLQKLFEFLGDDATVQIISSPPGSDDIPYDYVPDDTEDEIFLRDGDSDRLEAMHQDPRLCLLFDRTRKMTHEDVEFMLQLSDRILKNRDGDE